ncbi:MAG: beta-ketoacyl synthase chain length factor [Psychromonas sp.]|nr:beta-ketoacyl synthase chain length factor [Psychromonas sp.]
MNLINFNIDNWLALSPGLATQEEWINWSENNHQWPKELPPVTASLIKPMMRRRMSSLSKLALQAALKLSAEVAIDYIVFSSRHGELTRTATLISDIVQGEDASPMAFSQSVHNTAAGLFTINANRPTPVTSIAAVESTLHHALIEATIYIKENPKHCVLVVDFDEPLPELYEKYESSISSEKPYQGYAFAALLSDGDKFQLSWNKSTQPVTAQLPQTFSVIDFLLQEKQKNTISDTRLSWNWSRL